MSELLNILRRIEQRPQMYLPSFGQPAHSLQNLTAFITGFYVGKLFPGPEHILDNFLVWLVAHFGEIEDGHGWSSYILERANNDDRAAFDLFFRLLNQYLDDCEAVGLENIKARYVTVHDEWTKKQQSTIRTASDVSALVERELIGITNPDTVALIRRLLVPPRCEQRPWDYGEPNETFPCWIVAEHPSSNTAFAYCQFGFGPRSPWGLLWLSGEHLNMGMDSSWFASLEDVIKDSYAWEEMPPG
jgi:hypothetical protein